MFLPTTRQEMERLGWDKPDIILVTGDAYIDSSYVGVVVIGHVLSDAGYRVGIIGQPDINSGKDITRMGEPEFFWGVTAGAVDSMVGDDGNLVHLSHFADMAIGRPHRGLRSGVAPVVGGSVLFPEDDSNFGSFAEDPPGFGGGLLSGIIVRQPSLAGAGDFSADPGPAAFSRAFDRSNESLSVYWQFRCTLRFGRQPVFVFADQSQP